MSSYRTVFESAPLRNEFAKFLNTILYGLDDKKVFQVMDRILKDPMKNDEQIYKELSSQIKHTKKWFFPLHLLKALVVLQRGMGRQASELLKGLPKEGFRHYLEVFFERYVNTIRKTAKLALQGNIFSVKHEPYRGKLQDKIEALSLFSKYPYRNYAPLHDPECVNPELEPEKTYKPLGAEVQDRSIDLMTCLGGLHHVPETRLGPFVDSLHKKLRPGGILLLRDHDVADAKLHAIASVVHSFVNAVRGASWEVESREIRNFRSAADWTKFMEAHRFQRIGQDFLVLPDDPTRNGMMAFSAVDK